MPEYRRVFSKGGTYFFTVVNNQRMPLFADDSKIIYLEKCINIIMREYPFNIDAMVILPDHIHTIWTLPETDDDFSVRWMLIKKRFSTQYSDIIRPPITESRMKKREQGIWQRRFWEHLIHDNEDFNIHCDYIHYNPVKHGLVRSPGLWKHSSFNQFFEKGYYQANWGANEPETLQNISYE